MIQGIDISHWQDDKSTPQKMNFKKAVENGAKFVFIKVSERGGIDRDFEYNWKNAKEAGLLRGGYHFLRWNLDGVVQARLFSELLKDDPGELPPVADFEAPHRGSLYPSNALLEKFLLEVENKLERRPMIYTSPGFWGTYGRNRVTKRFDQKWIYYPLWVAHYMKHYQEGISKPRDLQPWVGLKRKWTFWQYTANGDGLAYGAESKSIDLDLFNGSLEELYDFAYQPVAPPTSPTPTAPSGKPVDIAGLKKSIEKTIDSWAKKQK
ncbi:MAG: glycoside hydrolase family 25 protein [Anaerolineaceae bacterium]|nr:glycoside hydrolase family 25 protein [Anaerolineaceae bacterium]